MAGPSRKRIRRAVHPPRCDWTLAAFTRRANRLHGLPVEQPKVGEVRLPSGVQGAWIQVCSLLANAEKILGRVNRGVCYYRLSQLAGFMSTAGQGCKCPECFQRRLAITRSHRPSALDCKVGSDTHGQEQNVDVRSGSESSISGSPDTSPLAVSVLPREGTKSHVSASKSRIVRCCIEHTCPACSSPEE